MSNEHGNGVLNRQNLAVMLVVMVIAWASWLTTTVIETNADRGKLLSEWSVWRGGVDAKLSTIQRDLEEIKQIHKEHGLKRSTLPVDAEKPFG